jgi:hypothetical protein
VVVIAAAMVASTASPQDKDPLVGNWKVNLAKSKGLNAPQSMTRTIADGGGGILIVTTKTVNAKGEANVTVLAAKRDGNPYTIASSTATPPSTMTFKKVDTRTIDHVLKDGSGNISTSRDVIAADGKSYTNTRTIKNARGQSVEQIQVWERQ